MCASLCGCGRQGGKEKAYAELIKSYVETNFSASLADAYGYYVMVNETPTDYISNSADDDGYTDIIARVYFGDKIVFFIEDGALETYKNGGNYQQKLAAFAPLSKEDFIASLIEINPAVADSKGIQETLWKRQQAQNEYYLPAKAELNSKWALIKF